VSGARKFAAANAAGGAVALFVFSWMITNARFDFFKREPFGQIQDAQARALFHGRWNIPPDVAYIEGFQIHGKTFTYFGPFLAVLRMPVLLVTDRLDGRLTIVSMILAFVVLLIAATHLQWRLRSILRADQPVTTGEAVVVGVFTFLIGAGSIVVFLGSIGLVYHEVELWGIAWAVAAADGIVGFAIRPSRANAIWASVFAVAAMMTRVSVGVGAVVALGLVAGAQLLRRIWPDHLRAPARLAPGADARGRWNLVPLIAGIVLAVGLYGAVNEARFGSPYQLPLDKQVFTQINARRRAALAANGGSLFGAKFVPTNLVQYGRPDALRLSSRFPYVDFPPAAPVIGGVTYDTISPASSVPASMPGFTVLAIAGVVFLLRPRRARATIDVARLWPPIVGGVLGTAFVLTIAFIANRYLADFFPPLLFAALIGGQRVGQWFDDGVVRGARAFAVGALVVLFLAGGWISFGLGRVYQRPAAAASAAHS
jgi:hypothetical protein